MPGHLTRPTFQTFRARQLWALYMEWLLHSLLLHFVMSLMPLDQHCSLVSLFCFISIWLQAKYHLCAAGWLQNGRVGYPTAFSAPTCGGGVVGIIDYGIKLNRSEKWDAFCYRVKGKGAFEQSREMVHYKTSEWTCRFSLCSQRDCPLIFPMIVFLQLYNYLCKKKKREKEINEQ